MGIFNIAMQALPHAKAALTGVEKLREKLKASQAPKPTTAPPAPTLGADAEKSTKQDLWNNINKQVEGGATQEEAFQRTFVADYKLNADTEHSNFEQHGASFLDDPMIQQATQEAGTAHDELKLAQKTSKDFASNLQNRWNTSIKNNINTLTGLAQDPRYMEWLSALGLDPSVMMELSQGREGYINSYVDNIKAELGDDIAWMENLDKITIQAEKDWNAKTRVMREEKRRIDERKLTSLGSKLNANGEWVAAFYDQLTGEVTQKVVGTGFGEAAESSIFGGVSRIAPSGKAGVSAYTTEGGEFQIDTPEDYEANGRYKEYFGGAGIMCAEFVNDIFGQNILGNSFAQKFSKVAKGIRAVSQVVPGMGFVVPLMDTLANGQKNPNAKNGHAGIIIRNNGDGTVMTEEYNWEGDGKKGQYKRNISDILNGGGFVLHPNADISEYTTGWSSNDAMIEWTKIVGDISGDNTEVKAITQQAITKRNELLNQGASIAEAEKQVFETFKKEEEPEEDKRTEATKIMDEFIESVSEENFYEELDKAIADVNRIKAFEFKDIPAKISGTTGEETQAAKSAIEQIRDAITRRVELDKPELSAKLLVVKRGIFMRENIDNPKDVISAAKGMLDGYEDEEGEKIPPMSPEDVVEVLALSGVLKDVPELSKENVRKWDYWNNPTGLLIPGIPLGKFLFGATDFEKLEKLFKKHGVNLRDLL